MYSIPIQILQKRASAADAKNTRDSIINNTEKKLTHQGLYMAMDMCRPEYDRMTQKIRNAEKEFLSVWNNYYRISSTVSSL